MPRNSSEYIVKEALLDADREFKDTQFGQVIDMRGMIGEVSIFESLEKSYLTAKIAVVDTQGIMSDIVNLQGTERLKLTISNFEEDDERDFTLSFRVTSVLEEAKGNDYTMVYSLNCVSEHAFNNANAQISRSYTGQLENIAEKVLSDYLDVEVDRKNYWQGETIQGRLKVIVPYLSPIDTASWLVERGCKENSSPIFMWQTIWDEKEDNTKVRLGDFSTMASKGSQKVVSDITKKAKEWDRSFLYSILGPNHYTNKSLTPDKSEETSAKENRIIVSEMQSGNTTNADTLKLINEGALGSRMNSLDAYTTQKFDRHFNLKEFLEYYRSSLSTPSSNIFPGAFDEKHEVSVRKETKSPVEFDSRGRNFITSYGTYEWENSYHDVAESTAAMNKIRKGIIRNLMYRDMTNFTLPGYSFMQQELGAGDCIGIRIKENYVDDDGKKSIASDHSGIFMILSLRHIFIGQTHRVVATCCKIEDVPLP